MRLYIWNTLHDACFTMVFAHPATPWFSTLLSAPAFCLIHGYLFGSCLRCALLVSFACLLLLFKSVAPAYSYILDSSSGAALITALVCVKLLRSAAETITDGGPSCSCTVSIPYCLHAQATPPVSCSPPMTGYDSHTVMGNFVCQLKQIFGQTLF